LRKFASTKEFELLKVNDDDDDCYIVERIVKKQLNSRLEQYEFLVNGKIIQRDTIPGSLS